MPSSELMAAVTSTLNPPSDSFPVWEEECSGGMEGGKMGGWLRGRVVGREGGWEGAGGRKAGGREAVGYLVEPDPVAPNPCVCQPWEAEVDKAALKLREDVLLPRRVHHLEGLHSCFVLNLQDDHHLLL